MNEKRTSKISVVKMEEGLRSILESTNSTVLSALVCCSSQGASPETQNPGEMISQRNAQAERRLRSSTSVSSAIQGIDDSRLPFHMPFLSLCLITST